MPQLWTDTIESHRRTVHDAILHAAATLVAESGVRRVTMSQIAERAGIGRATLYKYYPDVESMLGVWHRRRVEEHLAELAALRERVRLDAAGLRQVLEAYTRMRYSPAGHKSGDSREGELFRRLHSSDFMKDPEDRLFEFMRDMLGELAASGTVRDDLAADELAMYCLHALEATRDLPSKAAVRRLIEMTLRGLGAQVP